MEQVKRRKLNDGQLNFSDIDTIIAYDPSGSDFEDNESEVDESVGSLGVVAEESNDVILTPEKLAEDEKLKTLLTKWGVSSFLDVLQSCGINYENLEYLDEQDYTILIKNDCTKLGQMITFRHFHRKWKNSDDRQSPRKERYNDVEYILKSGGEIAEEIIDYHEANLSLNNSLREKLIFLILKEKRQIPRKILSNIADQICMIFPGEPKRVYYEKLKYQEPTGILYQKYKESREKKIIANESSLNLDTLLTDEVRSSIDFLNSEESYGENRDKSLIVQHWKSTFPYRNEKKYINATEAIDDWLPLQKLDGSVMIHLDFVEKYGVESAFSLTSKWESFTFRNQHEILKGIRDAKVKKSVLAAQSGNDVNIKNRIFIMALHNLSYTVPTKASTEKKKYLGLLQFPNQNSFLMVVNNSSEMDKHLKRQHKLWELKNIKQHPIIFELNNSKKIEYIIAVGNTTYESTSLINAVDDAFKIFVMFKIPFPPQCARVWLFLNELFYKITLEQKASAKIISMLDSYKM